MFVSLNAPDFTLFSEVGVGDWVCLSLPQLGQFLIDFVLIAMEAKMVKVKYHLFMNFSKILKSR